MVPYKVDMGSDGDTTTCNTTTTQLGRCKVDIEKNEK